jgi:hypothetical protein
MSMSMKFSSVPFLSLFMLAACTPGSTGKETTQTSNKGFEEGISLQGVSFLIQCPNQGSLNTLTITPSGLEGKNDPIILEIEGSVTHAEVEDLDANGFPEIYVYVRGPGSGSYGSLIAYACNRNKSLTPIFLSDLMEDKVNSKGYMGHDQFAVGEGSLLRRFPLYHQADSNSKLSGKPTGKTRQLQYKLKAGEAGWILRLDRSMDY